MTTDTKQKDVKQSPSAILKELIKIRTETLSPYQKGVNKKLEEMGSAHTEEALNSGISPGKIQSQSGLDPTELLSGLFSPRDNTPAMSMTNGGIGNSSGQLIPPESMPQNNIPAMSLQNGGIGNSEGQQIQGISALRQMIQPQNNQSQSMQEVPSQNSNPDGRDFLNKLMIAVGSGMATAGGHGEVLGTLLNMVNEKDKLKQKQRINDPMTQAVTVSNTNASLKAMGLSDYQAEPNSEGQINIKTKPVALNEFAVSQKDDQFNQKQWTLFLNKMNPNMASSRSTIGMAANGNLRAERARVTLENNPTMTYQDLGNVVGDLAGIYQGGAPTDMGMRHQQYESLQSYIANMKQYVTGKPQDAVPTEIKTKILDVINKLQGVNNNVLTKHLDSMEKVQSKLISKFPEEWAGFKQDLESQYMPNSNNATPQKQNSIPEVGGVFNGEKVLNVKRIK